MRKVSIITREEAYELLGDSLDKIFGEPCKKYILVKGEHQGAIDRFTLKNWFMSKIVYGLKYRLHPWN